MDRALGAGPGLTALSISRLAALPPIRPGDDLAGLIAAAAPDDLGDGDVLVVAHKVVSKAEGRVRRLEGIEPGDRARGLADEHGKDARLVQAVLDESAELLRAVDGTLICVTHHGFVCANAGVDQSNASAEGGELVLLPEDPDASAARLRSGLAETLGVRPALVIADSFGRAWRLGQTDVAIGAAGLIPLDQWIGRVRGRIRPRPARHVDRRGRRRGGRGGPRTHEGLPRAGGAGAGARALRHARGRTGCGGAPAPARAGSVPLEPSYGQPDEITTRHQRISMPRSP